MPDTVQTREWIVAALADNTTGAITPQVMRDWLISAPLLTDVAANYYPNTGGYLNGRIQFVADSSTGIEYYPGANTLDNLGQRFSLTLGDDYSVASYNNLLDDGGGNTQITGTLTTNTVILNSGYIQFADGSQQTSAPEAPPIPTLDQVLNVGNQSYNEINIGTLYVQGAANDGSTQLDGGFITTDGNGNLMVGAPFNFSWNGENGNVNIGNQLNFVTGAQMFCNSEQLTIQGGSGTNLIVDGSANAISANTTITAEGFFIDPSQIGGLQAGYIYDGGGIPTVDFGLNAGQFGTPNSAYNGGIFRLDSRGSYPFFQVLYQAAGYNSDLYTAEEHEFCPFSINNPQALTMPSVLIGWPTDGNNSGFGTGENLQVYGAIHAGGAITGTTFTGSGASLTSLNATAVTTGTIADARLTSNVVLKSNTNTITPAGSTTVATAGTTGTLYANSKIAGTTGTTAYTMTDVITILKTAGILKS